VSTHKAEHVVLALGRNGAFLCTHCGYDYQPTYPVSLTMLGAMMTTFAKEHRDCKPTPEGARKAETKRAAPGASVREWLASEDTGASSRTICHVLSGEPCLSRSGAGYPLDPDDFGRCHRLLELFPAWRERLDEVATRYPGWAPLVREWDALEAMFVEELPTGRAPKMYARMQELLREGGVR